MPSQLSSLVSFKPLSLSLYNRTQSPTLFCPLGVRGLVDDRPMSSQEATSKRSTVRAGEYRKGTDIELLSIGGEPAELFVLCGDRFEGSRAFKSGDLLVHIIRVSGSPVSMVSCMVSDHHWMLAKDMTALRVGQRAFVFAMPGFLYGLALRGRCSDDQVKKLEDIFMRFCAYQDLAVNEDSESYDSKPETDIWASAYSRIENLAAGNIRKPSSSVGLTARKIQRAVRTSAVVKLVSRALLSGALTPTEHLHLPLVPGLGGAAHSLPSMWAIADLLDAIEMGRWLATPPRSGAVGGQRASEGRGGGCWYFNRDGTGWLLEILRAYSETNGRVKKPRLDAVQEEGDGEDSDLTVGGGREGGEAAASSGAAAEVH